MAIDQYPEWICSSCGAKHGNRMLDRVTCWHMGTCDICCITASVTEPRDFGHLKDGWQVAQAKAQRD